MSDLMLIPRVDVISEIQPVVLYEHEAAKYIKLSVNDLRQFVKDGRITARRHPGRTRRIYLTADLDRYLDGLEKEGAA
jgi:excisionase family DNA binding protein